MGEPGRAGRPVSHATRVTGTGRPGRASRYRCHGAGDPVGHWGGRHIWQLADHADLLVGWKPTPDDDARAIEREMIAHSRPRTVNGRSRTWPAEPHRGRASVVASRGVVLTHCDIHASFKAGQLPIANILTDTPIDCTGPPRRLENLQSADDSTRSGAH